jgi:hypothetical protein
VRALNSPGAGARSTSTRRTARRRASAGCACRSSRIRPTASTLATPAIAAMLVHGRVAHDAGVAGERPVAQVANGRGGATRGPTLAFSYKRVAESRDFVMRLRTSNSIEARRVSKRPSRASDCLAAWVRPESNHSSGRVRQTSCARWPFVTAVNSLGLHVPRRDLRGCRRDHAGVLTPLSAGCRRTTWRR